MSSNTAKVIKGSFWSAAGTYTQQILSLCVSMILSRLIAPEDFGIIALLLTASGFLQIFAKSGLASAIVQHRDFSDTDLRTVFTVSLIFGCITMLIFVLIAHPLGFFFKSPSLVAVIQVSSISLFFTSVAQLPNGVLIRDFRNRAYAINQVGTSLISGFIAILMAFQGFGYWALVAQIILRSGLMCAFGLYVISMPLVPHWNREIFNRIFGFSSNVFLFQFVNYWSRNLDNILIGRILGLMQLGFYSRAYSLFLLPMQMLSGVISPVIHSALSKSQNDIQRMGINFVRVVKLVASVSIPVMGVVALYSSEIVFIVWGAGWEPSAPVFKGLAIAAMHQPILSLTGVVFLARSKTKWLFFSGFLSAIIYVVGILIGIRYGLMGVTIGYVISSHFVFIGTLFFLQRYLLEMSVLDFYGIFIMPICLSAVVFVIALCVYKMTLLMSVPLRLVIVIGGLAPIYIAGFVSINFDFVSSLTTHLPGKIKKLQF